MTALALRPTSHTRTWVRDFTLVGLVNGLAIPLVEFGKHDWLLLEGLFAVGMAVAGASVGAFSAWLFAGRARRWPKVTFIPLGMLVGLASGAVASAVALGLGSLIEHDAPPAQVAGLVALVFGGIAATQLAWFWLAYAYRRVNALPARGVLLLGYLTAAAIGAASPTGIRWVVDRWHELSARLAPENPHDAEL